MSHLDDPDERFESDSETDLGLPDDWEQKYIPTEAELQKAAVRRLDDEIAFVLLHKQNDPQAIADRLEEIADIARVTSFIKGEHQARGIRLGLALELKYWLMRDMVDQWIHLLMPLISVAIDLKDAELEAEVFYAWGLYHYYISYEQKPDAPKKDAPSTMLDIALKYAEASQNEGLRLLARAERFNVKVLRMSLDEARMEADAILARARAINFPYITGRIYFSLARRCHSEGNFINMFEYAQHSIGYFCKQNQVLFAGRAVSLMMSALHPEDGHGHVYRRLLVDYLLKLAQKSDSPRFQATAFQQQARQFFYEENYEQARIYLLKAQQRYRSIHVTSERARIGHMLGMIQTHRRRLGVAECYLKAAIRRYEDRGQEFWKVTAHYALALVPGEVGDKTLTLRRLGEVRDMAQALPVEKHNGLVKMIQAKIDEVEGTG